MWLWRVSGLFVLIVHSVYSQDAQTCYTNTGVTGVCTSLSACPAAFQLNINPFNLFGGSQRGCQNFFLIGSVCCAQVPANYAPQNAPTYNAPASTGNAPAFNNGQNNAPTYNVPVANPTPPPQIATTSAAPVRSSATTKLPQADPVSTTTARSSTIRTTPKVILQSRIDSEPTFDKPVLLPTTETGCGLSDVEHNRIVGGVPAALHGWPWMALVGYEDRLGDVDFLCGGSLITDRHVLSAAHCILPSLTLVRLGEHDLANQTESAHVDVPVYKYVSHPSYDTLDGHSDLAILYLTRTVEFNDAIKPICLPSIEPLRSEKFIGFTPFIAGWGRTKENGYESKVLQELQIPILENDECVQLYKKIRKLYTRKQFDNAIICAGVLEGGKDSCQGDSGGPLMLPYLVNKKYYYFQVGVVSYGIGCARAELPGVYTRVSNFIDWIQLQIKS